MATEATQVRYDAEKRAYLAKESNETVARAGALNLFGERAALSDDTNLWFGEAVEVRVEPDMHRDGVLFVE